MEGHAKVTSGDFKVKKKTKTEKRCNIVANGKKLQISCKWIIVEIWDSRISLLEEHIWVTSGLVAFKVVLGSFSALPIFPKIYDFQNAASPRVIILCFSTKLFAAVPFDSRHKSSFLEV